MRRRNRRYRDDSEDMMPVVEFGDDSLLSASDQAILSMDEGQSFDQSGVQTLPGPDGNTTGYDAYGNPIGVQYDQYGNPLTAQTDAYGNPLGTQYDAYGNPVGSAQQYDQYGMPIASSQQGNGPLVPVDNGQSLTQSSDLVSAGGGPSWDQTSVQMDDEINQLLAQAGQGNAGLTQQYQCPSGYMLSQDSYGNPVCVLQQQQVATQAAPPQTGTTENQSAAEGQIQVDENGNPIDTSGGQQYDQNGNPIDTSGGQQYDQNGNPVGQTGGADLSQYQCPPGYDIGVDQNGQPICTPSQQSAGYNASYGAGSGGGGTTQQYDQYGNQVDAATQGPCPTGYVLQADAAGNQQCVLASSVPSGVDKCNPGFFWDGSICAPQVNATPCGANQYAEANGSCHDTPAGYIPPLDMTGTCQVGYEPWTVNDRNGNPQQLGCKPWDAGPSAGTNVAGGCKTGGPFFNPFSSQCGGLTQVNIPGGASSSGMPSTCKTGKFNVTGTLSDGTIQTKPYPSCAAEAGLKLFYDYAVKIGAIKSYTLQYVSCCDGQPTGAVPTGKDKYGCTIGSQVAFVDSKGNPVSGKCYAGVGCPPGISASKGTDGSIACTFSDAALKAAGFTYKGASSSGVMTTDSHGCQLNQEAALFDPAGKFLNCFAAKACPSDTKQRSKQGGALWCDQAASTPPSGPVDSSIACPNGKEPFILGDNDTKKQVGCIPTSKCGHIQGWISYSAKYNGQDACLGGPVGGASPGASAALLQAAFNAQSQEAAPEVAAGAMRSAPVSVRSVQTSRSVPAGMLRVSVASRRGAFTPLVATMAQKPVARTAAMTVGRTVARAGGAQMLRSKGVVQQGAAFRAPVAMNAKARLAPFSAAQQLRSPVTMVRAQVGKDRFHALPGDWFRGRRG